MSDDAAPGTGQDTELARVFEQHRRHLRAIAYRMLGSLAEADDAVQETARQLASRARRQIRSAVAAVQACTWWPRDALASAALPRTTGLMSSPI